jgi:hypothetical protein
LIKADRKMAGACARAILPGGTAAGCPLPIAPRVLLDPAATAIEVGVSVGAVTTIGVAVGGWVAVAGGVRVGVRVRVEPNVGKGRSVAVGPIGRGVAVGALQAASSAIVKININRFVRMNPLCPVNFVINDCTASDKTAPRPDNTAGAERNGRDLTITGRRVKRDG